MMLTEDEAKTKRCQESFGDTSVSPTGHMIAGTFVSHGSALPIQTSPSFCLGSACMAWRWQGWRNSEDHRERWFSEREDADALEAGGKPERIGYCGKAGKP